MYQATCSLLSHRPAATEVSESIPSYPDRQPGGIPPLGPGVITRSRLVILWPQQVFSNFHKPTEPGTRAVGEHKRRGTTRDACSPACAPTAHHYDECSQPVSHSVSQSSSLRPLPAAHSNCTAAAHSDCMAAAMGRPTTRRPSPERQGRTAGWPLRGGQAHIAGHAHRHSMAPPRGTAAYTTASIQALFPRVRACGPAAAASVCHRCRAHSVSSAQSHEKVEAKPGAPNGAPSDVIEFTKSRWEGGQVPHPVCQAGGRRPAPHANSHDSNYQRERAGACKAQWQAGRSAEAVLSTFPDWH